MSLLKSNIHEAKNVHNHIEQFIDLMDEKCVIELCSGGYLTDLDKIYDIIEEETNRVINMEGNINRTDLNYLPNLKAGYEEYLRKMNLAYFVHTCMPNFSMQPFHFEWFNMAMMYPYLCIIASRGHGKSFAFSLAMILWDMYRYEKSTELITPPVDIQLCRESMLFTNEFSLTKYWIGEIKKEVEENGILNERLYPGRFAEGWSKESLLTKNGASLTIGSYQGLKRGRHPGRITVDDFLDESALYSNEARKKFHSAFFSVLMNMIEPKGRVRVVGCVDLDTIILSKEKGFMKIKNVISFDKDQKCVIDYDDHIQDVNGYSKTSKFFSNGYGNMRKISCSSGYNLSCSLIHPLWKMGDNGSPYWCKSSDLKVGDWIGIKIGNDEDFGKKVSLIQFKNEQKKDCCNITCLNLPDYLDEDLAYLIGLWIANGSIYATNRSIEISSKVGCVETSDFLLSLDEKYKIKFVKREKKKITNGKESSWWKYTCVSQNLVNFFEFLEVAPTYCNYKKIPDVLLSSNKKILGNIISGIFDGDGSSFISKDRFEISLSSTSEELINTIQIILLMGWGIKSNFIKVPLEKLKHKNFKSNFPQLTLNMTRNNSIKFCQKIGFRLTRKQKLFPYIKELNIIPNQSILIHSINEKRKNDNIFYKKNSEMCLFFHALNRNSKKSENGTDKNSLIKAIEYWNQLGLNYPEINSIKENCKNDVSWVQIKDIQEIEGYSVDFVIPETNSFIANGLISHNTPFSDNDLYVDLKNSRGWKVFEYPALFPDGSVLWPERFDFDTLMEKRKEFGNLIFSREILVRPISDSVSIFPYSILENAFIGMDGYRLVQNRQSYPIKFKKVCIGCDFALSGTASADYSVFLVMGLDGFNCMHLLHVTRLHGASHGEQIARIQRLNADFNANCIVMENNGFQKVMISLAKEAGLKNVIEHSTNGWNKKSLYDGIPSLSVFFENATIKFPRGCEDSIRTTNSLCQELNSMVYDEDSKKLEAAGGKDDMVMALWMAAKGLREVNAGFRISLLDTQ